MDRGDDASPEGEANLPSWYNSDNIESREWTPDDDPPPHDEQPAGPDGPDDYFSEQPALRVVRGGLSKGDENPFAPESLDSLLSGDIPPRAWLLGTLICRKYMTVLAASGGSGKTALSIVMALSMATGRPLIGMHVHNVARVLFLTFEDGRDEHQRRFAAACQHYDIDPEHVGDRILVKSLAATVGANTLAEITERNTMRETSASTYIRAIIRESEVDVIVLDPFVKASGAPENDNVAVDFVARILTRIAESENVAIVVSHHFRKGSGAAGDIDSARGARSLVDAARIALTLLPMTPEEAKRFNAREEEAVRKVRLDDGKTNLAPASKAKWFHLQSVNIGNGTEDYPNGDNIQVVEKWTPPDTWDGLSDEVLNRVLNDINAGLPNGERYSSANAAGERAAWPVVKRHAPEKSDAQCRDVISTWCLTGLLMVEEYRSPAQRRDRNGLVVDASKRPGIVEKKARH